MNLEAAGRAGHGRLARDRPRDRRGARRRRGAAVAVNYRASKSGADEVVEAITAAGGRAVAVPGDVAEYADAEAMVGGDRSTSSAACTSSSTTPGIAKDALIFNMEPNDWLDVMRVNFGGVFNCTKAAIGHFMGERGRRDRQHLVGDGRARLDRRVQLLRLEGRRQRLHPLLRRWSSRASASA